MLVPPFRSLEVAGIDAKDRLQVVASPTRDRDRINASGDPTANRRVPYRAWSEPEPLTV